MKTLAELFRQARDAPDEIPAPRPKPADERAAGFQDALSTEEAEEQEKRQQEWEVSTRRRRPASAEIPSDMLNVSREASLVGWQTVVLIDEATQRLLWEVQIASEYSAHDVLLYFLRLALGGAERAGGWSGSHFETDRRFERAGGQTFRFAFVTNRPQMGVYKTGGTPFSAHFEGVVIFNPMHVEIRKVKEGS